MWELTKSFRFEAAHALPGTTFGAVSEEIHGHSFRAEVTVRGTPDPSTGMLLDLGLLERCIAEVQIKLDHKLLNRIEALGPPTLENLSRFIWERVQHAGRLVRVSVFIATVAARAAVISGRRDRILFHVMATSACDQAIQCHKESLDCFLASLLAMTNHKL